MWRTACWEAAKRSGPCAVVANHGPGAVDEGGRVVRSCGSARPRSRSSPRRAVTRRSEEHTSELQSQSNLVCRLLLEKKKKQYNKPRILSKKNNKHT